MRLLRRIRGILGTALTWATGWAVAGAVWMGIVFLVEGFPPEAFAASMILGGVILLGIYGFLAGVAFSLVVLAAERRRTFHQLTLRRVSAWGGLGTILMFAVPVALSTPSVLVKGITLLVIALLGAGSAAASLFVARRGLAGVPLEVRRIGVAPAPGALEG
jgi:hypothetical protein